MSDSGTRPDSGARTDTAAAGKFADSTRTGDSTRAGGTQRPDSTAPKPALAPKDQYRVQVAAVATPAAADDAADAAEKLGYPAVIVRERGLYKVRAGSFGTREEAQAALKRIKSSMGGSPFVVSNKP